MRDVLFCLALVVVGIVLLPFAPFAIVIAEAEPGEVLR